MKQQNCQVSGCINEGRYCRIIGHVDLRIKPKEPIAKESEKREKINRKQYGPKQKEFLKQKPFCELRLTGCTGLAEGVHHVEGKENIEKLLDDTRWKSACNNCNGRVELKDEDARNARLKKSKHVPNYKRTKVQS